MANLRKIAQKSIMKNITWEIALQICDICFCETGISSIPNTIANRAYKARIY